MPHDGRTSSRVERTLDVVVHDVDAYPLIGRVSKTVNLSASGILMVVPDRLDVAVGQEVVVVLRWPGGVYEGQGHVVRLTRETAGDATDTPRFMGLQMQTPLPAALTVVDPAHAA